MPATYEPIATTTLSSAASSITFSSIPSTYTDLRLVLVNIPTASLQSRLTINGDIGFNYSMAILTGDGTTATSTRSTSSNSWRPYAVSSAGISLITYDIFSYTNSIFKTGLITYNGDTNGSGLVSTSAGLWRSTSAITQLSCTVSTSTYAAGTTATLYGILKA